MPAGRDAPAPELDGIAEEWARRSREEKRKRGVYMGMF